MACKCITNCEEKLIKTMAENHPEWKIKESSGFTQKVFMFDQKLILLTNPFEVDYTVPDKKGNTRNKTETINMNGIYCPFCGKAFDELEKKEKVLSKDFMTDFDTWEKELRRIVLAETGKDAGFQTKMVRIYYDEGLTPKQVFDKYWDV